MHEPSAIVIGAGIVGLAMARALALNGFRVDVFERSGKAGGASIRNFGMIWPVGQPQGELYDRAVRTRDIWKALAPEAGIWSDPVGSLHIAYHPEEWIVLQEVYEIFTREGRAVEWLDADAVQQKSPIALAKGCKGGLFSREELLVDPREALAKLPAYFQVKWNIRFHWGQAVTEVHSQTIQAGGRKFLADLVFICSGSDFESLYPEQFSRYPVTKCKLQMMRFLPENASERVGPAVCGGLSLIHYAGFRAAPSWELLRAWFLQSRPEYIRHGIHVMISQNGLGELTIGDSHEYGLCPDPFDKQEINELILEYLKTFISLKNARQTESWNGVYAKHTRGHADLFESPEEGVFILTATGGAGMTFAFGLAEERLASVLS